MKGKQKNLSNTIRRIVAVLAAMLLSVTVFDTQNVLAYADQDPVWNGFTYVVGQGQNQGIMYLTSYVGDSDTINIPSTVTIGEESYTPCLCSDFIGFPEAEKNRLKYFTVGQGVIIETGRELLKNCRSLESVNLSGAVTGDSFTDMTEMFRGCYCLRSLNLSGLDTSNVTSMGQMFYDCESLTELDLSDLDLTGIPETSNETVIDMFFGNDRLEKLILPVTWGNVDRISLGKAMYLQNGDTVETDPIFEATVSLAGKTLVDFPVKERVRIESTDKTVVYNGILIDIADMFRIPGGLQVKEYAVPDGLTLSGSKVEVNKAGKYTIHVYTAENMRYNEGTASATLTVNKGKGTGSISVKDVNVGTRVTPVASSDTNPGGPTFYYKKKGDDDKEYTTVEPTDAGEYTVMAVFPDTDLYECCVTADFRISNPYAEYGLISKYVPVGYTDTSDSPMIKIDQADCSWNPVNGKEYWYENGIKQGTYYDPKGVLGEDPVSHVATMRGREIYDARSGEWCWLDSCYHGAKAMGKEVWIPYVYQDEAAWDDAKIREVANESDKGMREFVYQTIKEKKGKWVRYDRNGAMLRGWVKIEGELEDLYPDQAGNTYYYDYKTGVMAKGEITIDGVQHYFDRITGVLKD